ncbi:hypothetical protein [Ferrimonas pelagia]|uniref:Uncharacterized protein n=1 Tax=Ferrimonas pelagia TaxID=1177826 RepID=A0ABP9EF23_9GAMM
MKDKTYRMSQQIMEWHLRREQQRSSAEPNSPPLRLVSSELNMLSEVRVLALELECARSKNAQLQAQVLYLQHELGSLQREESLESALARRLAWQGALIGSLVTAGVIAFALLAYG